MCNYTKELKFRYYSLPNVEKDIILIKLREIIKTEDEVLFAYVHGGFIERNSFRDIDLALWIKDLNKSLYYMTVFSVILSNKISIPVDIQVLNEAPLPFKYNVFMRGALIYSKDECLRLKVVEEVIRKYIDFKELIKSLIK